jgi:vacuolar-type H+-ATPase subunit F/Vma7
VEEAFSRFLADQTISVILVTQDVSEKFLREAIAAHSEVYPVILEIPAKESAYDPKKDLVMQRAHRQLYGTDIA